MKRDYFNKEFVGRLGIEYNTFWYDLTLNEALSIAEGIVLSKVDEMDRLILSARALTLYINNSFSKRPRGFEKVWPTSNEATKPINQKKWTLPKEHLISIFKGLTKDGRK